MDNVSHYSHHYSYLAMLRSEEPTHICFFKTHTYPLLPFPFFFFFCEMAISNKLPLPLPLHLLHR